MVHRKDSLTEVIERFVTVRVVYGETDCMQLCAAAVAAMTGIEHARAFPKYTSREDAMRIVDAHGGMRELITSVLGQSKEGLAAKRGDIVLLDIGRECAGVCLGPTAVTMSDRGMVSVPRGSRFIVAWSVK